MRGREAGMRRSRDLLSCRGNVAGSEIFGAKANEIPDFCFIVRVFFLFVCGKFSDDWKLI